MPLIFYGTISTVPRIIINLNAPTVNFTTQIGQARGLFSTVWVNAGYSGPVFYLRGSQSNAQTNIYSDGSNNYYTSSSLSGQTLAQWMASNTPADISVNIVKWYDQSGYGRDASQNVTQSQPIFDTTNYNIKFTNTGTPTYYQYLNLPDYTIPYNTGAAGSANFYTICFKHGVVPSAGVGYMSGSGSTQKSYNAIQINSAGKYNIWWNYADDSLGTYADYNRVTNIWNGTTKTKSIITNGTTRSDISNTNVWTGSITPNSFGITNGSIATLPLTGSLYYCYFFSFVLSDTSRNLINV